MDSENWPSPIFSVHIRDITVHFPDINSDVRDMDKYFVLVPGIAVRIPDITVPVFQTSIFDLQNMDKENFDVRNVDSREKMMSGIWTMSGIRTVM